MDHVCIEVRRVKAAVVAVASTSPAVAEEMERDGGARALLSSGRYVSVRCVAQVYTTYLSEQALTTTNRDDLGRLPAALSEQFACSTADA